ncbi:MULTISPECIES: hypothetical protein [Bacillus]|uniref:Uncharacterized protein n=1 Tax=Bacillus glycinifermentans TaxID=1664069 RepID=A0A0T6BIC8_9BACI|nr:MULTISPECIES: hypothetical protein [Bacillus]KRT87110.1 hypothetical protein AB447_209080 [Bacillus glycinifermentans]MEC0342004.1 hypothetical protein [Bacillus sonorensis]MEC0457482.1 hypothetical protein [Bacillus sonorensis]MEC0487159.1 hypothetical protein [Bacillus glycinifermentans]MEC0530723.1 hypothetical protein [Bacillus sonorensis]
MIQDFTITKIIKGILQENRIDCDVENGADVLNSCMAYRPFENKIVFNNHKLNATHHRSFKDMDVVDFVRIIAYHEIGHIIDFRTNSDLTRSRVCFEKSAWDEGLKLIPSELKDGYIQVREKHMEKINLSMG